MENKRIAFIGRFLDNFPHFLFLLPLLQYVISMNKNVGKNKKETNCKQLDLPVLLER